MCDLWPLFCSSDVILYKSMGCINSDLISNLFSKCGQRWNYLTLLLSMIISWNENALFTRISCALDGCLNSSAQWAEIPCQSLWFIHFSRLTCMWHSTKILFPGFSPHIYLCNHQFNSDNGLVMRRKMSNVLGVIGTPRFGSTMALRRSFPFWNSAGTWSCAPCKQFVSIYIIHWESQSKYS